MWCVFALDYFLKLDLYRFGVYPLTLKGLTGIIASPFIHSTTDPGHILNNSMPTFILSWMLFYHYRFIATKSLVLIVLLTGLGTWLMGRESYHIGMSGVIYGLASFITFSGFFRKNMRVASISLIVVFLYGSMIWGVFPIKENVSWESHTFGLFSGLIVAIIFKNSPPQPKKMHYEIEEELGVEPEHEYWKERHAVPDHKHSNIIVNYEIVPKKPKVEKYPDEEE